MERTLEKDALICGAINREKLQKMSMAPISLMPFVKCDLETSSGP